jgi:hypothetical protein
MNIRKWARGKPCLVRLPGCNGGGKTTVLAHYPLAGYSGVSMKPDDFPWAALACSHCHDLVDGRVESGHDKKILRLAHAEGCLRTHKKLVDDGILKISE